MREVLDCISPFTTGINRSLKMGLNKGCQFTVSFRTDVFRFLFSDKGTDYPHEAGRLYSLEDSDVTLFHENWYQVHDKLGDGCEAKFPVCLQSKVKWDGTVFIRKANTDSIVQKQKFAQSG